MCEDLGLSPMYAIYMLFDYLNFNIMHDHVVLIRL